MDSFLNRIDQPALILDENQAKANILFMVQKANRAGVQLRPHFKTHQSAEIGEWFRCLGVQKITVSSVEMAEYFANHGWQDICIAFPVNPRQTERIKQLASRVKLSVLVESVEGVRALEQIGSQHVAVWIKIDVGAHRTGLDWEVLSGIQQVCAQVMRHHHLDLTGLITHSGHTYKAGSKNEIIGLFREGIERLDGVRTKLNQCGFTGLQVSVGDTPGCTLCDDFHGAEEIRPGNFVFYDVHQLLLGVCSPDQIAVTAACPVVALHPEREEVVIYGGAIHLSRDVNWVNGVENFGWVALEDEKRWTAPIPGAYIQSLSQEHGIIHYPRSAFEEHPVKIGELVFVLPAHSCLTVQALGEYFTLDGKKITTMLKNR